MKKVFITGGSGTVGSAFIKKYYKKYKFYSYSRNEKMQVALKRRFSNIEVILGTIEDENLLISEMHKIKPDIIIHMAALKHVDTAEKQPSQAISINLLGSSNVVKAAKICDVPLTVGISTDKACQPDCVYGYTKLLMEKLFLDADNKKNKFVCCRFGNVAGSHGSVIPYWLSLKANKQKLKLTDPRMNRLMFSQDNAAKLIEKSIEIVFERKNSGFILSEKMKNVNMYELAKIISDEIEIVGSRPGEKLNEFLISQKELERTSLLEAGKYIILEKQKTDNLKGRLTSVLSSNTAEQMQQQEIKDMVDNVHKELTGTLLFEKQY